MQSKEILKVEDFEDVTDERILEAFDDARSVVSYYNAAEGNWAKETNTRNSANTYLFKVSTELRKRGLTAKSGRYLC